MEILKNKITAFEAIKKDLKKEILPTLNLILENFISLVDNKKIDNFTFRNNNENTHDLHPIHVSIGYKGISLVLGVMDTTEFITYMKDTELRDKQKISSIVKKSLKEINSNLYFLNSNFPKDMPILTESSYYSLALSNIKQINLFPEDKVALLPTFEQEDIKTNKNKRRKP